MRYALGSYGEFNGLVVGCARGTAVRRQFNAMELLQGYDQYFYDVSTDTDIVTATAEAPQYIINILPCCIIIIIIVIITAYRIYYCCCR